MASETPTIPQPVPPVAAVVEMLAEAMDRGLSECPAMRYASGSDVISAIFTFTARAIDGQLLMPGLTLQQRMLVQEGLVECCEKLWKRAAGVNNSRKTDDTKGDIKADGATRISHR